MDRVLTLEFVRVTEAAAVKAGRLMGKGNKMGADQLAVDGMHSILSSVPIDGTVVIGEGEMDIPVVLAAKRHNLYVILDDHG